MRNIIILTILISLLTLPAAAQSQGDLSVILKTSPAAGQIAPDRALVRTTLSIVDASGQTVPDAYLKLHLDSPAGNPIVSTDFPIVENTPLFDYEGVLPNGVFEFEYIYPIRGEYRFHIEAGQDPANLSFKDTLSLSINENQDKLINLVIMLAVFLGIGLLAGLIIGNGARAQRLATASVVLLLFISLASGSVAIVRADGGHGDPEGETGAPVEPVTESATSGDVTLTYRMDPGAGKVGTLNTLSFAAASSGALVSDTTIEVKLWHVEDDKPVFVTTLFAPTGQTQFDFEFFDGAEHEVRLAARNSLGQVEMTKVVEVEAVSPPLFVKVKTTIYLVLVTFVGILMGLRIQISRSKRQEFIPVGV